MVWDTPTLYVIYCQPWTNLVAWNCATLHPKCKYCAYLLCWTSLSAWTDSQSFFFYKYRSRSTKISGASWGVIIQIMWYKLQTVSKIPHHNTVILLMIRYANSKYREKVRALVKCYCPKQGTHESTKVYKSAKYAHKIKSMSELLEI